MIHQITGIIIIAALVVAPMDFAAPDIKMVKVKGGCYQMGDTFGDGSANEKPVHQICVDDFYIGEYEVTQAQWVAVMGRNPSAFIECGGNCPVEMVSWEDAHDFIRRLNAQTGKNYRLPYEAEWEYAARSGGKHEIWAGTSNYLELVQYACFLDNNGSATQRVGSKKPNGLGLYDMSGNVWEWCEDWYSAHYYNMSLGKNPHGPSTGSNRVLRGGSWFNTADDARAASRSYDDPSSSQRNLGFRLVLPAVRNSVKPLGSK